IVVAGLLAAFMSTFSATVNSAASFVVRDLFQPFCRKAVSEKQLVTYSRVATVAVVVLQSVFAHGRLPRFGTGS
ncbi:hypothetical protein ACFL30_03610, partial [Candidatus Latescibacterota bacterium]